MHYTQQQQFLSNSRIWGAMAVGLVIASAAVFARQTGLREPPSIIEFGLTAIALALSIYYTPDYLHLTVNPEKRLRWQIRIRWRLIGAVLALGLFSLSSWIDALVLAAVIGWLVAANLLAARVPRSYCPLYFWTADFIPLAALLFSGRLSPLLGTILLAAAAHLSIVISEQFAFNWAGAIGISACLLLWAFLRAAGKMDLLPAAAALLLISALAAAFLVNRAQKQNAKNIDAAMRELVTFTGFPHERIRSLWATSNQELAKNWQQAGLADDDPERLAEWYRENSQLYLFAISAYNLEYKRIRSNLKVLRLARGSCLDYGAGNGEIVLELARRGHRVTYYDVAGETMKFARQRALRQRLEIEFLHSKEDLAASARKSGFDTVFSFDVLEHLPDLPGELNFLSSLLNPGGLFVFDVPAGSTKSHPMHLNHNLRVRTHLLQKGLQEELSFVQRLPFRKEEKYFFRASLAAERSDKQAR